MDSIYFKLHDIKNTTEFRQYFQRDQNLNVHLLKSQIDLHLSTQEKNQSEGVTNFLIIDLDGTILNNWPRQLQILLQEILPKYPHLPKSEILNIVTQTPPKYSLLPFLHPFCQISDEFQQIEHIFLNNFLSNKFLNQDRFYPGINSFFEWLRMKNIHLVFLTGRLESQMRESTQKILVKHIPSLLSIPFTLCMKRDDISDFDHKQVYLEQLSVDPNNHLVAFIDNESEMCSLASQYFPECLVVHFNSPQSNNFHFSGYQLHSWQEGLLGKSTHIS
jgi:hypothetical protein